jgi:hypothetical protein
MRNKLFDHVNFLEIVFDYEFFIGIVFAICYAVTQKLIKQRKKGRTRHRCSANEDSQAKDVTDLNEVYFSSPPACASTLPQKLPTRLL